MLGLVLLVSGCAPAAPEPAVETDLSSPPDETTFVVTGQILAPSTSEIECELLWGAWQDPIDDGQVTVHDGAGDAVALGKLAAPTVVDGVNSEGTEMPVCVYGYRVEDVPSGVGPYTFAVGGELESVQRFTEEDAKSPLSIDVDRTG